MENKEFCQTVQALVLTLVILPNPMTASMLKILFHPGGTVHTNQNLAAVLLFLPGQRPHFPVKTILAPGLFPLFTNMCPLLWRQWQHGVNLIHPRAPLIKGVLGVEIEFQADVADRPAYLAFLGFPACLSF